MSTDPWTVYWHGDHLESCIASVSRQDGKQIALLWEQLASQLSDASRVLDLASGNGAIPKLLLSVNSTLKICAVDKAAIAPHKYLSQARELTAVRFLPETDICDLPFAANSFDVVTSQFGLEYAPVTMACQAAARVLKRRGKIQLLMHHRESEILRPTTAILSEMARLLEGKGVMAGIKSYLADKIDLDQLETIAQQYLQADIVRTQKLSGQIFSGINQIVTKKKTDADQARALAANMEKRLLADQSRIRQLREAALDTDQAHQVAQTLRGLGIRINTFKPFTIEDEEAEKILIGWQLCGVKE